MSTGVLRGHWSLTPAYGRDYMSPREAVRDFIDGKDFTLHGPDGQTTYCSIRDFAFGEASAVIHFNRARWHGAFRGWRGIVTFHVKAVEVDKFKRAAQQHARRAFAALSPEERAALLEEIESNKKGD